MHQVSLEKWIVDRNNSASDNADLASTRREDRVAIPSRLEWVIVSFALIVQQGAFISIPLFVSGLSTIDVRSVENPVYTASIAVSMALIVFICLSSFRKIGQLLLNNLYSLLFVIIVLISATWSIHPEITERRGASYVLTILIAAYLAVRFGFDRSMKVLSCSFAIAAIGSILFVIVFPQFGIMQLADVSVYWRGVFPHKNVLGPVMSVAVFTELYLVISCNRPRWRLALLGLFLSLVILSRSVTALIACSVYLVGTFVYLVWKHDKVAGGVILAMTTLLLMLVITLILNDPDVFVSVVGRDLSITGRTELWNVVYSYVQQRPMMGYGYQATWVVSDANTALADEQTGGYGITNSQNGFLEITLQLGLLGLSVILGIIANAFWRGLRCCSSKFNLLGWFSVMFFLGTVFISTTEISIGQNQNIHWLVFNILTFCCGQHLSSLKIGRRHTSRFGA